MRRESSDFKFVQIIYPLIWEKSFGLTVVRLQEFRVAVSGSKIICDIEKLQLLGFEDLFLEAPGTDNAS